MTDSSTLHMVGVAIPTLRGLRAAVFSTTSTESAVGALRDAGFAGGDAVHSAFQSWLPESSEGFNPGEDATSGDAGALPIEQFSERVARFFRDAGWGDVSFSHDESGGVAILDIEHCWEAGAEGGSSPGPGCHISTGLLAAFFGRIAGYPVAVLETECADLHGSRCRFLMGNPEMMNYKWEQMRQAPRS